VRVVSWEVGVRAGTRVLCDVASEAGALEV